MFVPLIMGDQKGRYEHITMALLDSSNLLQQLAINAGFHRSLHTSELYAGNNLLWMASFTTAIKVLFVANVSIKIYTSVPLVGEKTILGTTNWD